MEIDCISFGDRWLGLCMSTQIRGVGMVIIAFVGCAICRLGTCVGGGWSCMARHILSTVVHTALWEGIETYRSVYCCISIVYLLQDVILENKLLSGMCERMLEIWIVVCILSHSSLSSLLHRADSPPLLYLFPRSTVRKEGFD